VGCIPDGEPCTALNKHATQHVLHSWSSRTIAPSSQSNVMLTCSAHWTLRSLGGTIACPSGHHRKQAMHALHDRHCPCVHFVYSNPRGCCVQSHTELGVVEVKHLGERRTLVARYDRYSSGEAVNGRLAATVAARATTTRARAAIVRCRQLGQVKQISHESSHVICLNLPKLANLPLSSLSEALSGWRM